MCTHCYDILSLNVSVLGPRIEFQNMEWCLCCYVYTLYALLVPVLTCRNFFGVAGTVLKNRCFWQPHKDHKAVIKEWADKMKQKDCATEKRAYIERASDQRHEGGKSSFHKSVHQQVNVHKAHHGERIVLCKGKQQFLCAPR